MRKIVAGLHITADGVVEAPERWQFPYFSDELVQAISAQMAASDTMLLGRRTYEEFAGHWPNQPSDDPIASYMNTTPKLVASTTLKTVEWQNSTVITGDLVAALTKLKQEPGKDISITGSGTLIRSLLRHGLLDQLMLMVSPIVVGHGKRLFEDFGERLPLKLLNASPFSTGVVSVTYAPERTTS
jgi:dihydrofolate reductase